MRLLALILALLLPATDAFAQARKDSVRHQNNHLSVPLNKPRQAPTPRQWPQNQPRTQLFCDQYARAAASDGGRIQGAQTGVTFGEQTGYVATRDRKQAEALGMIGGTIGSAAGAQVDRNFYNFHLRECLNGGRLITTPK
ncbi:hypothetical protein shim_16210 [Shimia sp. SK013]|uniref:hypothetical protein n=1 Tax=Shimia sp. SK013 TaxID=1389006 RepID=UPI0006B54F59|nr:hypothetical protein [Shimia sp. SK013]KPA22174.1 hypothetical protein shim_16210 [Shimia sp. SK013]